MNKNEEEYKVFKQVLHAFYHTEDAKKENVQTKSSSHHIKIEPFIIYDSFLKTLKVEFRIGEKQLYKLKSLPEFYDRMMKKETYRYGAKLEFKHTQEAFREEDWPLLSYILKYAEIIKYTNQTMHGMYGKYGRTMSDEYITLSNTGLDDLFEVLKNKNILFKRNALEQEIFLSESEPDIIFSLQKTVENNYELTVNIDVFSYDILEGRKYIYFVTKNTIYRCGDTFKNTVLKLLQLYRNNYVSYIKFKKEELPHFCSFIYPILKDRISLDKIDPEIIDAYIPKKLYVKLYLDFNENNYIIADVRFAYGDIEFNPLLEQKTDFPRDAIKENEYLDLFIQSGFRLDKANARLILPDEDAIYQFISKDIEKYMSKFEVLATENFKNKEIRQPQMGSIGVRIENDLLKIDFSKIDFDLKEIQAIMNKYQLKKKYHRLKDGSFLQLEDNETMQFINSVTEELNLNYDAIQNGELQLPIYRSMYLDRLLQKLKCTNITRSGEYKELVGKIETRHIDEDINPPKNLHASLRNYQKVGYSWLKNIEQYGLGGILADDMGLRENSANVGSYFIIYRRRKGRQTKYCGVPKLSKFELAE